MYRSVLLLGVFTVLVSMVIGCGEKLYKITGKVTLDDKPIQGGYIRFVPTVEGHGSIATGITKEDGTYVIQTVTGKHGGGTTAGEYVITFSKLESKWDGQSYYISDFTTGERMKDTRSVETLPTLYTRPNTSPFTVTVGPKEKNEFNFELNSKP